MDSLADADNEMLKQEIAERIRDEESWEWVVVFERSSEDCQ
jgi:hypothetical protein